MLLPERNKVLHRIKQGGGPDLAHGPCVCHLCPRGTGCERCGLGHGQAVGQEERMEQRRLPPPHSPLEEAGQNPVGGSIVTRRGGKLLEESGTQTEGAHCSDFSGLGSVGRCHPSAPSRIRTAHNRVSGSGAGCTRYFRSQRRSFRREGNQCSQGRQQGGSKAWGRVKDTVRKTQASSEEQYC